MKNYNTKARGHRCVEKIMMRKKQRHNDEREDKKDSGDDDSDGLVTYVIREHESHEHGMDAIQGTTMQRCTRRVINRSSS